MINHEHYTYRVIWSQEDGEFVGLCVELPSLSYLADTQTGALQGIIQLAGECAQDMADNGEDIPEPLSQRTYSGKFMVRMPPEQHRNLAIAAAEQGISLNRYVASRLS